MKTVYEQARAYAEYQRLMVLQPHFTHIPKSYFINNPILGEDSYTNWKLGLPVNHITTFGDKLRASIMFPEICSARMLGIHPRPYQHYALDQYYRERYSVAAWGRRLGKTICNRLTLLHTGRFNLLPSEMGGTTWNIVLQDQDLANDLYIEPLHEIMEYADRVTAKTFQRKDGSFLLGEHFWSGALLTPRDKVGKVRVNKISFRVQEMPDFNIKAGITRLTAFGPTPKVIGREGNLMGDEVSKWKNNPKCKDEFKFYDQLIAILKDNPRYKGIFSSTPEGEDDVFAREMFDPNDENPKSKYHKIWFPYWVRNDPHWLKEIHDTEEDSLQKRRHHTFLQEYEASFLTISDPFFHPNDVSSVVKDNWRKSHSTLPCSLGIDWGGTEKSETSWVVTEWDLNPKSPRRIINKKSYPVGDDLLYLEGDLRVVRQNYNIKWVTPDNKGGRWMMPRLDKMFGKGRVNQMNFTTDKRPGYETFRQAIIDNIVELPNDTKFIKQMLGLTDALKPASSKGLDDEADAAMMSLSPICNSEPKVCKVWNY